MTDRELLELAAKAAGRYGSRFDERGWHYVCTYPGHNDDKSDAEWELWDPLTDDGDALRLAVKLNLEVVQFPRHVRVSDLALSVEDCHEPKGGDPYAATRRAIVRAAAAIGQSLAATSSGDSR